MVVGTVTVATTARTYDLHIPALALLVLGAYVLVAAVVPDMRGSAGLRQRALATLMFWTVGAIGTIALWQAGL